MSSVRWRVRHEVEGEVIVILTHSGIPGLL